MILKHLSYILLLSYIVTNSACQPETASHSHITHKTIKTSDEAIQELLEGNKHFYTEVQENNKHYKEQIEATKYTQHPHSLVLACIDSRVVPEIIFDQQLGQLFVARVAGNVDDDFILASIEFAVKIKHTKLIVVLGHKHCGAVNGAIENVQLEHLTELANQIKPAISEHESYPMDDEIEDITSKKNVLITIQHLLARSKILNEAVQKNEIKIIGAFYNIENGIVTLL